MGPSLRFRRTALITGSASLIRSLRDHLLLKGKAWRAGEDTRPYPDAGTVPFSSQGPVPDRPARIRTGSVGSSKPGAEIEPHQRQFLHTQGPVARREFRPITQILRAENFAELFRRASPVTGTGGKANMGTLVPILSRPPAILKVNCPEGAREGGLGHWFLSHRWERNSPPAGGETPLRKEPSSGPMRASGPTKKRSIIAPSSVTASPCHLPPKGKALERLLPRGLKGTAAPLSKKKRRCHPCP